MPDLAPIIGRFAEHEFEIRRRWAHDPDFKAICEDYVSAARALERWENDSAKAKDYRHVLRELENEVLEHLTGPRNLVERSPGNRSPR